jgi:hypothetical protein
MPVLGGEVMYGDLRCASKEPNLATELTSATDNVAHDAVFSSRSTHRLRFTGNVFAAGNDTLSEILSAQSDHCSNVAVFVDANVARSRADVADQIGNYFERHLAERSPKVYIIPGGEQIKNSQPYFKRIWRYRKIQALQEIICDRRRRRRGTGRRGIRRFNHA